MTEIEEILGSKIKPKEKMFLLAAKLKEEDDLMDKMTAYFSKASIANRGTCMEAIANITGDNPKFAEHHLDFIIEQLDDKAPRVKWEAATVIANVVKEYPGKVSEAIPRLLDNTKHEGTVVRWSAARALTKIAVNNPSKQSELITIFNKIVDKEENNGVKNVYLKAMKTIARNK